MKSGTYLLAACLVLALAACSGGNDGSEAPAPRVVNDAVVTNAETPVVIDVLGNDFAIIGSTLTTATSPGNGTAELTGTTFSYTPDAGFTGTDTFRYTVSGINGRSLTGTVTVIVNAAPTANADSFSTVVNTPVTLAILANDIDTDGALTGGITITTAPNGTLVVNSNNVRYTPPEDFIGDDSFAYQVTDDHGAISNSAIVTVSITDITTLSVSSLTIPQSGYTALNNAELGATVLSSPLQPLTIPANTVSFTLMLRGTDVNIANEGLFIANLVAPDGMAPASVFRYMLLCQPTLCTADLPKRPGLAATAGDWQFRLGTEAPSLVNIDFSDMQLQLATRVGPRPDLTSAFPATIPVHPFLTATSVTPAQLQPVLDQLIQLAANNNLALVLDPLTVINDVQFAEVSSDFTSPETASLITMGDADKANIFFLEGFSGPLGAGQIGIAPGIPGTVGVKSNLNGVLVSATATLGRGQDFYARTTAEIALHELGHLFGLFHTTETDFSDHDILDDTPECPTAHDFNANSRAEPGECPDGLNIMFSTNDLNQVKEPLTDDQKEVLFFAPIATP